MAYLLGFGLYGDSHGFDQFHQPVLMTPGSYEMYQVPCPVPSQQQEQQGASSPESMSSRLSPSVMTTPLLSPTSTITEKIANVNKLPESFLPEFHQYSKETYENGSSSNKKRKRNQPVKKSDESSDDEVDAQEVRRQIHIQSEQKRRAQIKDGFEELRQHLPGCINKKMSKAALLHRSKYNNSFSILL